MKLIHGDCLEEMAKLPENSVDTIITDPPYGLHFMGKSWDHGVPGVEFWKQALRVAKPGAMMLAFGGTRTHHRLTCAIEDAGWDIRDCIMYLYGAGMPKSLNISKQIDKHFNAERKITKINPTSRPNSQKKGGAGFNQLKGREKRGEIYLTEPETPEAKQWDGWGTNLKPSYETIILSMKSLDGNFAENALKHGVAGLNIDGARIKTSGQDKIRHEKEWDRDQSQIQGKNCFDERKAIPLQEYKKEGRWPSNVIFDEESAQLLKSHKRFFYCAKVSPSERGDSKHPTMKPISILIWLCNLTRTPTGGIVLDPFMGSGSTGIACLRNNRDFIGIELEKEYFDIAQKRIQEESMHHLFFDYLVYLLG